jgi:transcriptional regulator with PAS, ATPase and Fis domain
VSTGEARGRTLVAAADPALRDAIARALEPLGPICAIEPRELLEPARFVDAAALVLCLEAGAGPNELEQLAGSSALPVRRSAVLLIDPATDEALLEDALRRLVPAHVLSLPAPPAALRFAVDRVLAQRPSRGARGEQRSAPALLGVSTAIHELLDEIARIAPSRAAVLIQGETGTGKELVARAVHEQSPRAARRFVAVNCGALPDNLLEAELFGFEKGAFTGAERSRRGLFEEADGGTLFLDEIGDTSPAMQVKLLRAIESGEVRPLGATAARRIDVRIVSATHRDLEAAIDAGAFRQDLYYRLNTVPLYLPPLRRRRVDIAFLAQHFAEGFGAAQARRIVLGEDFLAALERCDFPGNVRELRNAVERAITLAAPGEPVGAAHVPRDLAGNPERLDVGTLHDRVLQVELHAIREALLRFDGNRTRVAEALGLSRVGLRQKMRRLGLEEARAK